MRLKSRKGSDSQMDFYQNAVSVKNKRATGTPVALFENG
jgi:hypothetical protein